MKILLVSYSAHDEGGAGLSTYILAKELKKLGVEVFIASTNIFPGIKSFVFKKFRFFPIFFIRDFYLEQFLNKIIKKYKIDIIHSSESRFIAVGSIKAAERNSLPAIVHYRSYWFNCLRGSLLQKNRKECSGPEFKKCLLCFSFKLFPWTLYKWFYCKKKNQILRKADINIAISQKVAEELKKSEIGNTEIVYNPIEMPLNFFNKEANHEKSDDKFVVGYLGKIAIHKGIKEFLEIANSTVKKNSNIFFLIVGDGELKKYAKRYIEEKKISNNVFLNNGISYEDLKNFYKLVDVMLFPFLLPEPFGRVIVEAMAFGKVVLASNRGGAKEIISDNKNGFLINPENTEESARKILEVFYDKNLQKEIGRQAILRAQDFASSKSAKEILNIYKKTLSLHLKHKL